MNSIERVMASVTGEQKDRPAFALTLSLYGSRLIKCPVYDYYTNSNLYFEGQVAVQEEFKPDLLFSPFVLSAEGESFGSQVKYISNQPPIISEPGIKIIRDIIDIEVSKVLDNPRLTYIRESVKKLSDRYKNEIPIVGIVLSPVDLPLLIFGMEAWLETILFDPYRTKLVLEKTSEFFVEWSNSLIDAGANLLALPAIFCKPNIIPMKVVIEIVIPAFEKAFSQIKGPLILHHGGNQMVPFLEYLSNLPNVVGYVIDGRDNFSEAREKVGPNKVLLGNITGATLNYQSRKDITQTCESMLNDRISDPHYIFATSAADIPYDTPPENIHSIVNAVKEFKYD